MMAISGLSLAMCSALVRNDPWQFQVIIFMALSYVVSQEQGGALERIARTVTENGRTLKFEGGSGFEPGIRLIHSSLKTKLVALWVLHHDPILPVLFIGTQLRGTDATEPLNSGIDTGTALIYRCPRATADIYIKMDAVLDDLGLRHALEVDARPTSFGIDNRACFIPVCLRNADRRQEIRPARIAFRRVLQLIPQCLRPERRHARRVGAIKCDLNWDRHQTSPDSYQAAIGLRYR